MTERKCFPTDRENTEYVLSELDEETPTTSSEDSVTSQKLKELPEDTPEKRCSASEPDEESLYKFEKNAINKIMAIKSEVDKVKEEILSTEKEVLERDFKKYEETLILKTLSLDNVQTKGIEKIKETRKDAILFVQDCLKLLDSKVK